MLCTVSIIRVSGSSAQEDSIIEDTYHAAGEGAASNAREHSACDESIEGTVAVGEDDPGDDHGNTEKNRSRVDDVTTSCDLGEETVRYAEGTAREPGDSRQEKKGGPVVLSLGRAPVRKRIDAWVLVMHLLDLGGDNRPHEPHAEAAQQVRDGGKEVAARDELADSLPLLLVLGVPDGELWYEMSARERVRIQLLHITKVR